MGPPVWLIHFGCSLRSQNPHSRCRLQRVQQRAGAYQDTRQERHCPGMSANSYKPVHVLILAGSVCLAFLVCFSDRCGSVPSVVRAALRCCARRQGQGSNHDCPAERQEQARAEEVRQAGSRTPDGTATRRSVLIGPRSGLCLLSPWPGKNLPATTQHALSLRLVPVRSLSVTVRPRRWLHPGGQGAGVLPAQVGQEEGQGQEVRTGTHETRWRSFSKRQLEHNVFAARS